MEPGEDDVLYFAYTARLAPDRMVDAAPSAAFAFVAHLSGWGLSYTIPAADWRGALPSATLQDGSTVWGAVYDIEPDDLAQINTIESAEGREPSEIDAIDRSGQRFRVTTHVSPLNNAINMEPSHAYVRIMVDGSRHWGLPAGWVIGLEDQLTSSSDHHAS
ncbi:MAG: gamma-glutamylcyclotransferase [Actinomycetota bacterium]